MKRIKRRIAIWFKRLVSKSSLEINPNERYALSIVRKLLSDKMCELYLHPTMQKRYIKNEAQELYVTIIGEPNEINLINHRYAYNLKLGERTYNNIVNEFDNATQIRRDSMEKEFNSNIQHSLRTISESLEKNTLPYA